MEGDRRSGLIPSAGISADLVLPDLTSCGSERFIEVLAARSAATDDWEDRCDLRLPLRAADRTDGSELPEENEGDSVPVSGDCKKLPGELDNSCDCFSQGLAWKSPSIPDGAFGGTGKGAGVAGPGGINIEAACRPDGVAGGGGWSFLDGSRVLMEIVKVDPCPGTPLALMSPP